MNKVHVVYRRVREATVLTDSTSAKAIPVDDDEEENAMALELEDPWRQHPSLEGCRHFVFCTR